LDVENLVLPEDYPPFSEGKVVLRLHQTRERKPALVAEAKRRFRIGHGGQLFCEVCNFDFSDVYGDWGGGYIEAHHKVPLSDLKEETEMRAEDLAMVCANCHRILHRRPWPTVEKLRAKLKALRRRPDRG
jgi:putative restriction endonuclease